MGEALNRLNSLSDEEIIALSPEQFSRLKKDVQREANVDDRLGGQDNLLGIGPDLNRPLRALQPVDVPAQGNEDFGGVFSTGTATDEDVERTFSRYDAKKSNAMRNLASLPLEFLKVINSPLDTAEHLGLCLWEGLRRQRGQPLAICLSQKMILTFLLPINLQMLWLANLVKRSVSAGPLTQF